MTYGLLNEVGRMLTPPMAAGQVALDLRTTTQLIGVGTCYTTTTEDTRITALREAMSGRCEFRYWSWARDLNPGPHGPEL
jgi:hypothetical protein